MKRRLLIAAGVALLGLVVFLLGRGGDWPEHEGKLRQVVRMSGNGLRRGGTGSVFVWSAAVYTSPEAYAQEVPFLGWKSTQLTLVGADNKARPVLFAKNSKWSDRDGTRSAQIQLPDVPDGDYKLHLAYETRLGRGELDLKVPLYAPARVHVITDRPLYEPGNLMKFRAVVLRARDLAPLDGRPGRWLVTDPNGDVVLEEQAPAGEFGVVAGSFPIDKGAQVGTWKVQWSSDSASADAEVRVEPFTLPRFRVTAETPKPFYRAGERPLISGAVSYSSGAPVANANLSITWNVQGEWRPPNTWDEKLLPKHGVTGADGRFELDLPQVPADLRGKVSMTARIAATDSAGDRVQAATAVLLSEDGIQASIVTELGDQLAQGFNNRVYVRVTTPDGQVVANAKIKLKRTWQANDPGVEAVLDEDGVASAQLDPGPPVNVVVPPMPWRSPLRAPEVSRSEPKELFSNEGASLADQVEMDKWLATLAPCAKWVGAGSSGESARVGLRVSSSGSLSAVGGGNTELGRCVVNTLRARRLPTGKERMYAMSFDFSDPDLPSLNTSVESATATPDGFVAEIELLAAGARDCLPQDIEGSLPRVLTWRATTGQRDVPLAWAVDSNGGDAANALSCATSRMGSRVQLDEPALEDSIGVIHFSVSLPESERHVRPQATTRLGYQFTITADIEGSPSTKLVVDPGTIPDLRMRVSPVLAAPGDSLTAELLRGPNFSAELPQKLQLQCLKHAAEAKLDKEHRTKFKLPREVEGWCQISGGGAQALVYVKPTSELKVTVASESPRYAPGQQAKLNIQTLIGGRGGRAAIGLFGVDESLAQLATLRAPDDMASVQPKVETPTPAFGTLEGQALALGRIRGANAAAATVLRVGAIPPAAELDALVEVNGATHFDAIEELTDRFYAILPELYAQARAWEANSKASDKMRPATMAALWDKALAACESRKERVDDAFGRRLSLQVLPADLLALTDPHVVVGGTRVPEDVENWAAWVQKAKQ
jgi:hypothetical protein